MNIVEILVIYGTGAVLVGGVAVAANWLAMSQLKREREAILEERRRNRRMAREYLRALEKIAAEFLAQGVKLSTEMLEVQKVLLTAQLDAEDEEESQRG